MKKQFDFASKDWLMEGRVIGHTMMVLSEYFSRYEINNRSWKALTSLDDVDYYPLYVYFTCEYVINLKKTLNHRL